MAVIGLLTAFINGCIQSAYPTTAPGQESNALPGNQASTAQPQPQHAEQSPPPLIPATGPGTTPGDKTNKAAESSSDTQGQANSSWPRPLAIADVMKNPANYTGKFVRLSGKITAESTSGGWFIMDDGTGSIYVDLTSAGIKIPENTLTRVKVIGEVAIRSSEIYVIFSNFEF